VIFGLILKYLTTVLDTILDVDNYLRTSPQDQTPRARVAERVTSLLRYVADFRDQQGRPYSKVIIVAHSLGSMVTTDLLRYLERSAVASPDRDLARYGFRNTSIPAGQSKLPIIVFSMGSPLRQLLNRFFPHLYWWIGDVPDNSRNPLGSALRAPIPAIHYHPLPRIDEMNVARWCNAYRSGDYVGRSLWIGQWFERNATNDPSRLPDIYTAGAPPAYEEMCIGSGAHTHYWDRSAPDIANLLDQLIT
jgi:pimeloyl-ACP methyl ester carboxylesterase